MNVSWYQSSVCSNTGHILCVYVCSDLEFKQRQPEVEQSQVTMSLKIGSGYHGEVRGVPHCPSKACVV